MPRPLLAVVGPTCTGKTRLAVQLAVHLAPAELLNADSRQVRRGLRVGTCAPTQADLRGIRCHLVDLCNPGEPFTVADWIEAAKLTLADIDARGALAIVVGGTGLYVTALLDGFDFASTAPAPESRAVRDAEAATPAGLRALAEELSRRDPTGAARTDLRNPRRVVRALEILDARAGGLDAARGRGEPLPAVILGLHPPAAVHRAWIEERTERMFREGGLLDEVRTLREAGLSTTSLAASGIGYREALAVIEGDASQDAALETTVQRTLRYAKAQRTYWRRDHRVEWLNPVHVDALSLAGQLRPRLRHHHEAGLRTR